MTSLAGMRQMAWEHEFDHADEELGTQSGRIERLRRMAALHHRCRQHVTARPSPTWPPAEGAAEEADPNAPDLSTHGGQRLQQRGITRDQVVTVMDYGREQRVHGASRYFLDKKSRVLLATHMASERRSLPALDIQVVLSDHGTLITAAHRTKRLRKR